MNGNNSGKVTWRKVCQRDAPSISAASNGSAGKLARPPSAINITSGVHCHTSTITRPRIAKRGEYTHSLGPIPSSDNR